MTSSHTPKPPTKEQFERLWQYSIDVEKGTVRNHKGREINSKQASGYVIVGVYSPGGVRAFKRSHVIWWKSTGEWPKLTIDHINRIKDDDRIVNLREATMREQGANLSTYMPGGKVDYGAPWLKEISP